MNVNGNMKGKVALVTGAGSGIGKATAVMLGGGGAKVGVLTHTESEARETEQEIGAKGGEAVVLVADVAEARQMQAAVEKLVGRFGRLDLVHANAGINGVWAPIDELQPEEWDRTINTNLRGTYLTLHFAVPHLKRAGGGAIVITARRFGVVGLSVLDMSTSSLACDGERAGLSGARRFSPPWATRQYQATGRSGAASTRARAWRIPRRRSALAGPHDAAAGSGAPPSCRSNRSGTRS